MKEVTEMSDLDRYKLLEEKISYQFQNKNLLLESITHKSFYYETGKASKFYNERLEYLGDTVLNLVISDFLYHTFLEAEEGPLSQRRAALVSEDGLADIAQKIEIEKVLLLGKGEKLIVSQKKNRMLACALEALIGAIYLDGGFDAAKKVLAKLFLQKVQNQGDESDYRKDYKTVLQEMVQKNNPNPPTYHLEKEDGPSHDKTFYVSVRVGEKILGFGEGKNKKQAEQLAAQKALEGKTYES